MRPAHFLTEGTKDKFLIQDPFGLREVIQPVVSISLSEDRITGLGTCFQVSPWLWLTAHHVVRHSSKSAFADGEVGAVGFSMGLVYGAVSFDARDVFGEIRQCLTYGSAQAGAPPTLPGPTPPDILVDIAALRVNVDNIKRKRLVSPLAISNHAPAIGEELLAIGYPILGTKFTSQNSNAVFEERMFGATGVVKAVHLQGTSLLKPWPTLEIEGDWEAGMSGGPVINQQGNVVGIVSSSFAPSDDSPGVGFAVLLPAIRLDELAPEVDFNNPGFVKGFGLFKDNHLVGFYATREIAALASQGAADTDVREIICNPKTEDWMSFSK